MELRGIFEGDVVRCCVRGLTFKADVIARDEHGLTISVLERHKLPRGLVITRVTARQVTGRWRQSTAAPRRRPAEDREAVPA